ncbi:MAG: substrate-binding domain-containing protein [Chloroflexi bacterium]|nr:substrate-binding domain-containing protein [Chloroflexota bacterium]
MCLVAEHLVKLGHRRIACIVPNLDLMFAHYRLEGLCAGLAQHGIELRQEYIRAGNLTQWDGYEQAVSLLSLPEPPTAIAAGNDLMALGAMSAAQERGLVVGKDIAITGFDDIPLAEHAQPPLTTVNQPIYLIGNMVCEMLIGIINGKEPEHSQILLKPSLVVRQSCGSS